MWNLITKCISYSFLFILLSLNPLSFASSIIYSIIVGNEINLPSWIHKEKIGESNFNQESLKYYVFLIFLPLFPLFIIRLYILSRLRKPGKNYLSSAIMKNIKKLQWNFWIFEWLYFLLSIAGIILAIRYNTTGAFISVVSTVEQRINKKAKDWLEEIQQKKKDDKLLNLLEEGQGSEYLDEVKNRESRNLREVLVLRLLSLESLKQRSGQVSIMEKEIEIV